MPSSGRPLSNRFCGARGLSSRSHRRRPAGEDDALGLQPLERFFGGVERRDLAIDAGLAHAPRDQLRHLAAEVDDEDGFGGLDRHGGRIESAAARVKLSDCLSVLTPTAAEILKHMLNDSLQLDRAFHALSDPVRRGMLSRGSPRPCLRHRACRAVQHQPPGRPSAPESAGGERTGPVREERTSAYRAAGAEDAFRPPNAGSPSGAPNGKRSSTDSKNYLRTLKNNGDK